MEDRYAEQEELKRKAERWRERWKRGLLYLCGAFLAAVGSGFSPELGAVAGVGPAETGVLCGVLELLFVVGAVESFGRAFLSLGLEKRVSRVGREIEELVGKEVRRPLAKKGRREWGIVLGHEVGKGEEVFVSYADLVKHVVVFGSSGSGKSEFLRFLAFQHMLRGGGMVFVDAKRDEESMRKFVWLAKEAGRWRDLRVVDGGDWQHSHGYNPLSAGEWTSVTQLVQRISAVMPPVDVASDAMHYRELINQALAEILECFVATGKSFTMEDVLAFIREPRVAAEVLVEELRERDKEREAEVLLRLLREWGEKGREAKFKEQVSTLASSLRTLLDAGWTQILGTGRGEVSLNEVADKNLLVYVALPFLGAREACLHFMRSFQEHLKHLVGRLSERGGEGRAVPIMVFLDEFGEYVNPEFASVVRMARSARIAVVLSVQTPSVLKSRESGLSDSFARDLLNNLGTVICFQIQDPGDAEWLARRWGEHRVAVRSLSLGDRVGKSEDRYTAKRFISPKFSVSSSSAEGLRETREMKVSPSLLLQGLKKVNKGVGRAVVETLGGGPWIVNTCYLETDVPPGFTHRDFPRVRREAVEGLELARRVRERISLELRGREGKGGGSSSGGKERERAREKVSSPEAGEKKEGGSEWGMEGLEWILGL